MCSRRSAYYHRHVIAIFTHNEEIVSYFSVEPGRLHPDSDNSRDINDYIDYIQIMITLQVDESLFYLKNSLQKITFSIQCGNYNVKS